MSNYDRVLKLHIHNSEVAERAVNTFLISESVILGFLSHAFFNCCASNFSQNNWLLLGGSIFGLLLIIPCGYVLIITELTSATSGMRK